MSSIPTSTRIMSNGWAERGVVDAIKWEVLRVPDGTIICVEFEEGSKPGQGVWLASNRGITVENQRSPQVVLWKDSAPREVALTVHNTDSLLHFYNVWQSDAERNNVGSKSQSSAMRQERVPNGFRYSCNDIGFNEPFDSLVFRVQLGA